MADPTFFHLLKHIKQGNPLSPNLVHCVEESYFGAVDPDVSKSIVVIANFMTRVKFLSYF